MGKFRYLGDSGSPALPPAGALLPSWYRAAAQLLGAPWDSTWRAKASDCQTGWEQQGLFHHFSLELKHVQHLRKDLRVAQVSLYSREIIPPSPIHSDRTEQPAWVGGSSLVVTSSLRLLTQVLKLESETDSNLHIHLKKNPLPQALFQQVLCPTNHPFINKLCSLSTTHR